VAEANIEVDMIIQNISKDGKTDFSFTVNRNDFARALSICSRTRSCRHLGARKSSATPRSARSPSSASACAATWASPARCSDALSEEGINIQMISTSEIKISVVIDEKYMELAVRALHKAFDLDQPAA
jgi:aspartate kinase